jgi:hypothetical protein
MTIHNLYSKRLKHQPDIFIYDDLSDKARTQIQYIIEDFIKINGWTEAKKKFHQVIFDILTREHGVQELYSDGWNAHSKESQLKTYLLSEQDIPKVIDTIEVQFKGIKNWNIFTNGTYENVNRYSPEDAIDDLNTRFRENGLGYKFDAGIIIKIDNELLHNETTKPVLQFLIKKEYETINDEFLMAYNHYRHGNFKECLNECLKALETTLKIICDKKGWSYTVKDTSSKLIQIVFQEKLIPDYLQSQITSLRATIESGVPTIRNRNSGHGQGTTKISVEESLVSYTLNLTGSSIKFLIELYEASIS